MARPSKFNRDTAVESAMHKMWKNGMSACSVKALSEHLNISRSSFYNAFGSREGLFKEALDLYTTRAPDRMLADIDANEEILPAITRMFREVCRVRAADPDAKGCMAVNCVADLVGVDKALGPVLEEKIKQSLDRFAELLQRAARNGEIPKKAALREKALALQNLLIGINILAKVIRSEADLWATARQTLRGLGLYKE